MMNTSTMGMSAMGSNKYAALKNQGELVERRPLTAWELYAQSLLSANEFVYVN